MSEKASALSTDQIDIENGERYDINFTDKNGKPKHPLILHCSPSGAIERVIYALLEKEAIKISKGKSKKYSERAKKKTRKLSLRPPLVIIRSPFLRWLIISR